jgi:hypothetical protein
VYVVERDSELGLTNQLQDLARVLLFACENNVYIAGPKIKADLSMNVYRELDDFLDIESTNENLKCTKLIPQGILKLFPNHSKRNFRNMIASNSMKSKFQYGEDYLLSSLVISPSRVFLPSNDFDVIPHLFYGVHFRMEADWVMFDGLNKDHTLYWNWLAVTKNVNNGEIAAHNYLHSVLNSTKGANRTLCLLELYKEVALKYFSNTTYPVVFATGLGKSDKLNTQLEFALDYFRVFLHSKGFKTITGCGDSQYRELNAAADMKVMLQSQVFIGDPGSSFSYMIKRVRDDKQMQTYYIPAICV